MTSYFCLVVGRCGKLKVWDEGHREMGNELVECWLDQVVADHHHNINNKKEEEEISGGQEEVPRADGKGIECTY